jgi:hypothetical protein
MPGALTLVPHGASQSGVPSQGRLLMSRWTIAFLSLSVIAFSLAASAADDGLQRNIALKPGAAPTDEAAGQTGEGSSSGMTTRRFFTEGKNAPTTDTSKDWVAPETAPPASAPSAPAASPLRLATPRVRRHLACSASTTASRRSCYPRSASPSPDSSRKRSWCRRS